LKNSNKDNKGLQKII